jgi:hypothetical protein
MTGIKPDSHKKRPPTRHTYNEDTPSAKKRRVRTAPDVVGVLVTQTQSPSQTLAITPPNTSISNGSSDDNVAGLGDIVNRLFVSPPRTTGSPIADAAAVAEMVSGGPIRSLNFGKPALLQKQKKKLAKQVPFKLDSNSVFPFLRTKAVDILKQELATAVRKPSHPRSTLRTARSFFDTIAYSRKVKVTKGHSQRLANAAAASTSASNPSSSYIPDYDIKKVRKVSPGIDFESMNRSLSLDSRKLRRYIVEDVMFADPDTFERIL